ncbi:MAG: DUF3828 domain-containing protein [Gemmatimonadaceae bacterium]
MSRMLAGLRRSVGSAGIMQFINDVCFATVAGLALSTATSAAWAQTPVGRPTTTQPAATKHVAADAGARPTSSAKDAAQTASSRMDTSLHGTWRISIGVLAPWVAKTDKGWDTKSWVGQTIRFEPNRVAGPGSLKCAGEVGYEATSFPADALFQGGLPAPVAKAIAAAKDLGFAKLPAKGTSLNCDAGLFEFHQVDATAELVAINNVIWTLDRSPGALASATTPSGVVQRFLETHFAGDMGFDSASVASKRKYMSTSLTALSKKYFAKPVVKDEVPDIDGDPFTDSQEYPTRFSVGAGTTTANASTVRVKFSDAHSSKVVTYLLSMDAGTWRIDDVRYDGGPTLRALLAGSYK